MAQEPRFRTSQSAVGTATTGHTTGGVQINSVLRNTYMLLGMTLAFSAVAAYVAMVMGVGRPPFLVILAGFFGLLYLVEKTADSGWGLLSCFVFTGFLGFITGPVIAYYMSTANGPALVTSAFATASAAFVGLSAFTLVTRKDFGFLGGFLMVGFFVLMGAVLVSWLFNLSAMHTAISAGFVIFASAAILWQTSAIIHGGERNYIRATVSLFVSFYNLFMSLLHIFGIMGDD